ncbi:hypothetical protein SFC43_35740 [Bacteroides sp. CR5/BHMF/2]|nr:hypothetical protein [Bacteroides sp. CR5/BHMF/2]
MLRPIEYGNARERFSGQPAAESQNTIVNANPNRSLRLFTVQRAYSSIPEEDVTGQWEKHSKVCFYF